MTSQSSTFNKKKIGNFLTRGEVLEDVLGLENRFWSPWPWPRRSSPWPWPQVLENWSVLGSRTAVFFELLKFCGALEKFFGKRFFVEITWKIFVKTFFFFFGEHLRLCPWSLALASSIPVFGLERVCPRKGCPWPWPWTRIFLCPWPWPRALCPRLHFCFLHKQPLVAWGFARSRSPTLKVCPHLVRIVN